MGGVIEVEHLHLFSQLKGSFISRHTLLVLSPLGARHQSGGIVHCILCLPIHYMHSDDYPHNLQTSTRNDLCLQKTAALTSTLVTTRFEGSTYAPSMVFDDESE